MQYLVDQRMRACIHGKLESMGKIQIPSHDTMNFQIKSLLFTMGTSAIWPSSVHVPYYTPVYINRTKSRRKSVPQSSTTIHYWAIEHIVPQSSMTIKQSHSVSWFTIDTSHWTNNKSPLLLIIRITILVLIVGINVVILISGDVVGHLLSIGTNQVAPVLLGVMGGANSLRRDASVKAI